MATSRKSAHGKTRKVGKHQQEFHGVKRKHPSRLAKGATRDPWQHKAQGK